MASDDAATIAKSLVWPSCRMGRRMSWMIPCIAPLPTENCLDWIPPSHEQPSCHQISYAETISSRCAAEAECSQLGTESHDRSFLQPSGRPSSALARLAMDPDKREV